MWHLAQLNVGIPLEPLDSERLSGFMDSLDPINAIADAAPGFVWRLQTEDGNATAVQAFEDPNVIVNLSVWESLESLGDFVYRSNHVEVMRKRRQWFEVPTEAFVVLWWVPAGTIPTVADAVARLERLRAEGPTPEAFTFRTVFPAPGDVEAPAPERDACLA
jgi:hypothetical protein